MRAWLMHDFSGIEGLRLGEAPDPVPKEGEALLHVAFAGLNPADRYLSERQYPARPTLPHILGRDGAGTVVAVGPAVEKVGSREWRLILRGEVGGDRSGTFAELVCVPVESLAPIPEGWSIEESSGAALVYLTAYQALTMWGELPKEPVVLITGASGGVGVASVQLASALGARVVALTRSPEKAAHLRRLGAALVLDPQDTAWNRQLKEMLAPRRVDLALDNIGGSLLPQVIDTLGDQGKVSIIGRLAGPVPEFNTATLFFRRIRLGGVAVGANQPHESQAAWRQVVTLLARTGARPVVDCIFPFEDLPRAFEHLAKGPMGKVLLRVAAGSTDGVGLGIKTP
jgi:NADPH:quinone reductase